MKPYRHGSTGLCTALLCALALQTACWPARADAPAASLGQRVASLEQRAQAHPRSAAVHANLAALYLEQLSQSHDLALIEKIDAALQRSLAIQPNLQAWFTRARLFNYRHRFADALAWAGKVERIAPEDTALAATLVEAYLGIGDTRGAEATLKRFDTRADFNIWATRAQRHAAAGRFDQAAAAFAEAGAAATRQGEPGHARWALINRAGMYLDSGRPADARPYLEQAQRLDPSDRLLRIHWSEYALATGQPHSAYALLEALLSEQADAHLEARAFRVARQLGKPDRAQQHFEQAERSYRRALAQGEIFTLGALAELYCDAGVRLEAARALANDNLNYKRDAAAHATLARLDSCDSPAAVVLRPN